MSRGQNGKPGIYNATPITLSDQEGAALALDVSGRVIMSLGGANAYAIDDSAMPATPSILPVGGEYRSSATTYTDGDATVLQSDVNGNLKVTNATLQAGEDLTNDVLKVEQRYTNIAISTATTTTVKSGAGYLNCIRVIGGTLGNVTIYDNTAGSGTVLCPTVTPVQNGVLLENITFSTGLTVVTAAATVITGSYR